jgi:hypothetical protein
MEEIVTRIQTQISITLIANKKKITNKQIKTESLTFVRPFEPQPQLNKAPSPNTNPGSIGSFVKLSPTLNPKLGVPFPGILASAFTTPACALLANTVELATSRTALTPPPLSAISSPRNLSETKFISANSRCSTPQSEAVGPKFSAPRFPPRERERGRAQEARGAFLPLLARSLFATTAEGE